MDFPRYLELLDADCALLRAAAVRDLAAPVPCCPGWTTSDVLFHTGEVFLHKIEVMRTGAWPDPWPPEPDPRRARRILRPRRAGAEGGVRRAQARGCHAYLVQP
ncbi:hypothetical protein GCM10020001_064540 [Nonomuraea salmonea]